MERQLTIEEKISSLQKLYWHALIMKVEITKRRWILYNISLLINPVSALDIISSCFYKQGLSKVSGDSVTEMAVKVANASYFLLAVCLELTGDIASSLATYEAIATLLAEVQSAKDRVLIDWVEHGLYRGSLLSLGHKYVLRKRLKTGFIFIHMYRTQVSPSSVLEILRAYQRITAAQNITWRLAKRLNVTRYSFAYLTDIYRQGKYTATAPRQNDEKQNG